jgi:hypothetical protein
MNNFGDNQTEVAPSPGAINMSHALRETEKSSLPSASERAATQKMDSLNFGDKLNLTHYQTTTLKTMETAILRGDMSTLQSTMNSYKDNPNAATPIMNVLVKDLRAAGIRADYSVDYPMNSDGKAELSGMLSLSTAKDAQEWHTKDSNEMCLYTNPKSAAWAEHMIPNSDDQTIRTPRFSKITPEYGLDIIGQQANKGLQSLGN